MRRTARLCLDRARALAPIAAFVMIALASSACDDESPSSPSPVAIATIRVQDQQFKVRLVTRAQIDAARQAQAGGRARIPNGRIVSGTDVNTGWSWHLEDVEFAENTIELCDGLPSDVERDGTRFDGVRFCPWSAVVLRVDS